MVPNFYTIDCPRCNVLEKKLRAKRIDFNKITDFDTESFVAMGYVNMPLFEPEPGVFLEYKDAVEWVNAK